MCVRVCDVRAVYQDPDGRRAPDGVACAVAVAGIDRSDGVHVHMRVVRGWADGVPSVSDRHEPGAWCVRGVGVECRLGGGAYMVWFWFGVRGRC